MMDYENEKVSKDTAALSHGLHAMNVKERSSRITASFFGSRVPSILNSEKFRFFIILITIDALLELVLFAPVFSSNRMLSYGNASSSYFFGPLNLSWVETSLVALVVIQALSHAVGVAFASNSVIVTSLFAGSVGIYFFSYELTDDGIASIVSGLVFGTILDPLVYYNFIGGPTLGYFQLFIFLSFTLLIRNSKASGKPCWKWEFFIAGILYGLGIAAFYVLLLGVYVTFPFVLIIFVNNLLVQKGKRLSTVRNFFVFLAPAISILLPIFVQTYQALGLHNGVLLPVSIVNSTRMYISSIFAYEYKSYSLPYALQNAFWVGGTGFITTDSWYLLVDSVVVAGTASLLINYGEPDRRLIYQGSSLLYIVTAMLIYSLANQSFVSFVTGFGIFDYFDYPFPLLLVQQISLVFMFPCLTYIFLRFVKIHIMIPQPLASFGSKRRRSRNRKNVSELSSNVDLDHKHSIQVNKQVFSILVVTLLAINSLVYINHVDNFVSNLDEVSIPPYYSQIHHWFQTDYNSSRGLILVLPNSYRTYIHIIDYIPSQFVWNIPPLFPSTYNVSQIENIMTDLASGDVNAFAYQLIYQDVGYLILLNGSQSISLIPSGAAYRPFSPISLPSERLRHYLNSSTFLGEQYSSTNFVIYSVGNSELGKSKTFASIGQFVSESLPASKKYNLLNNSSYNEIGYYPHKVLHSNNSYFVDLNPSNNTTQELFYINANLSSFGNSSPYTNRSLELNVTFNITGKVELAIFIQFYNSSSPSGFWSQEATLDVGYYVNSSQVNYSLRVPNYTKYASIAFNTFTLGNTSGNLTISEPSLALLINGSNISASITEELPIYTLLQSAGLVPQSTLMLAYPFSPVSGQLFKEVSYLVFTDPYLIFSNSTNNSEIVFIPSDISRHSIPSSDTVYIFFINNGPAIGPSLSYPHGVFVFKHFSDLYYSEVQNFSMTQTYLINSSQPLEALLLGMVVVSSPSAQSRNIQFHLETGNVRGVAILNYDSSHGFLLQFKLNTSTSSGHIPVLSLVPLFGVYLIITYELFMAVWRKFKKSLKP